MIKNLEKYLFWILLGLLAYLPFHGILSTWAYTNFGYEIFFKSWKEIVLVVAFILAGIIVLSDKALLKKLWDRLINKLIIAYGLLHLVMVAVTDVSSEATAHALVINLRFLAVFLIAQVVVEKISSGIVHRKAKKTLMIVATVVAGLAILQVLLPKEFLEWFGYSKETIPPYFTIDRNYEFMRYASTTRGPNVLGAYLILPITMATAYFFKKYDWKKILSALVLLAAMVLTFSRSAWLGLVAAVGTYKVFFAPENIRKIVRRLLPALVIFAVVFLAVFATTDFVQNTVFHQDPDDTSNIVDSNAEHWTATKEGIEDIVENPLGSGPGSAGPASFRNDEPASISENYFVQIGQEVGVIGLALFIWINVLLAKMLLTNQKRSLMKPILFSVLIGLSVVSMLLHGWADEEVAITFWLFAGLYLE